MMQTAEVPVLPVVTASKPDRCVMVMDKALSGGHLANAIAVIALTVGQRHPALVGDPISDASGHIHPGLIPIGIPMLCAEQDIVNQIRSTALEKGCDVVDFPVQGQRTKNYEEFKSVMTGVLPGEIEYTGLAIVGSRNVVNKITRDLEMMG